MTATIAVLSLLLPPVAPPSPAVSQPRQPAVSVSAPIQKHLVSPSAPSVAWGSADAALWGRVKSRPGPTPFYHYPQPPRQQQVAPTTAEVSVPGAPGDGSPVTVARPLVLPEPLTLRERALARFAELGAPAWVIDAFDCIGRNESGWTNSRSKTGDSGTLQINDVHRPELDRLGLDPYVPEDAASFAWRLFVRAGWSFRDWVVAPWCGLR